MGGHRAALAGARAAGPGRRLLGHAATSAGVAHWFCAVRRPGRPTRITSTLCCAALQRVSCQYHRAAQRPCGRPTVLLLAVIPADAEDNKDLGSVSALW